VDDYDFILAYLTKRGKRREKRDIGEKGRWGIGNGRGES